MIENVFKPLAECVLILLGLTAAASATDAAIHKKMLESGLTTLIISKEQMEDIKKIVKDSGLWIKSLSELIKNGAKLQKGGFLSMSLGTLGASWFGNLLTGKVATATNQGQGTIRAGKGTMRAGENF